MKHTFREHLSDTCIVDPLLDHALVALQGPRAEAALAAFVPEVAAMRVHGCPQAAHCRRGVFRFPLGYTGEDGFEISLEADKAEDFWVGLLRDAIVMPAGLGARDSLRLEAGLCLYGSDLDLSTTPVEAALEWRSRGTAQGRRAQGRIPGRRGDLGADRRRRAAAPRRAQARRARARARRRAAFPRMATQCRSGGW